MSDENFSRAFEFIEADNEDSAIQELVFTAIAFLEERVDFPHSKSPRDQIQYALGCFKKDELTLKKPAERKNDEEAQRLLDLLDSGSAAGASNMERFTEILVLARPNTELIVRAFSRRATHFLALQNYRFASGDFQMALDNAKSLKNSAETNFRLHHKLAQCFAKMKKYSEAVEHLKLALKFLNNAASGVNDDDKLKHQKVILDSVMKMAKKKDAVEEEEDAMHSPPEIVGPQHKDLAGVSRKVKIVESELQGRFAIAESSIAPGEVVTIDEPASFILNPDDPEQMFNY